MIDQNSFQPLFKPFPIFVCTHVYRPTKTDHTHHHHHHHNVLNSLILSVSTIIEHSKWGFQTCASIVQVFIFEIRDIYVNFCNGSMQPV